PGCATCTHPRANRKGAPLPKGNALWRSRSLPLVRALSGVTLLAIIPGAQTPPVPSKTLPSAQAPGGMARQAFQSPQTGRVYSFQIVGGDADSDQGETAEELEPDTSAAAPRLAPAAPSAKAEAAARIPKSEFYN